MLVLEANKTISGTPWGFIEFWPLWSPLDPQMFPFPSDTQHCLPTWHPLLPSWSSKLRRKSFFFFLSLSSIGPCYNAELAMDFSGKGLRNILRTSATQSSAVFLLPAHGSWAHVCVFSVAQPCPALCDPTDCSPLGCMSMAFSRQECYKWVAISSSRVASWPRDPLPLLSLLFWQADSLSLSHWNTP